MGVADVYDCRFSLVALSAGFEDALHVGFVNVLPLGIVDARLVVPADEDSSPDSRDGRFLFLLMKIADELSAVQQAVLRLSSSHPPFY